MSKPLIELTLRPYPGKLWVARTPEDYEKACVRIFGHHDTLKGTGRAGRFTAGNDSKGKLHYLVWAEGPPQLAHEFAHVIFDVFGLCGINPSDSLGEAFCYMLSQLLTDHQHA